MVRFQRLLCFCRLIGTVPVFDGRVAPFKIEDLADFTKISLPRLHYDPCPHSVGLVIYTANSFPASQTSRAQGVDVSKVQFSSMLSLNVHAFVLLYESGQL